MIGGAGLGQLDPYTLYVTTTPGCLDARGSAVCPIPASVMAAATAFWASSPEYQPAAVVPTAIAQLAMNPVRETLQGPVEPYTVPNLQSYLSSWAAAAIANPGSITGDPQQAALSLAITQCQEEPTSDCGNASALAMQIGAQVATALANRKALMAPTQAPAPVVAAQPVAPAISPHSTSNPPAPAPPVIVNPSPPSQPVTATTVSPLSLVPPVIVNPSPPSQAVTTGSTLTAPGSVLNQANGTAVTPAPAPATDFIPGLPNEVLVLGGAAVVLLFLMTGGK